MRTAYSLMYLLMFTIPIFVQGQVPLRSVKEEKNEYIWAMGNDSETMPIDLRLSQHNFDVHKKHRKGKALLISGLAATAMGIAGLSYAVGPDLKDKLLINTGTPVIDAFMAADAWLGIVSTAFIFNGLGLTTWGTIRYLKSK